MVKPHVASTPTGDQCHMLKSGSGTRVKRGEGLWSGKKEKHSGGGQRLNVGQEQQKKEMIS